MFSSVFCSPEGPCIQLLGNSAPKYHTIEGIMGPHSLMVLYVDPLGEVDIYPIVPCGLRAEDLGDFGGHPRLSGYACKLQRLGDALRRAGMISILELLPRYALIWGGGGCIQIRIYIYIYIYICVCV